MQGSIANQGSIELDHSSEAAAPIADSHHAEHPDLRLFGFILFLTSESMLFLGLFVAYLTFRSVATSWPPVGTPDLEILLPGINTVILLSSSLVIHKADDAVKANDLPAMRRWFLITMAMGITFLAGQLYEYMHLEFGLKTNLFASTFYVLTGFHGLHVMVGVILMSIVLWRSRTPGHYSSEKHFGVEAAEIYWHFVDVIWVLLFLLLYIL
jgi:cytochrome c oxidase subunit III